MQTYRLLHDFIPEGSACDTHENFAPDQPSLITIHWIGPYPGQTPAQVRQYWIDSKGEASAHYIIKDDEVLQCWPLNKVAWHAGCKAGNTTSIGIEVCPCDTEGRFSERSIQTLKELLETFPRYSVVRHHDWTGKDCPAFYCNSNEWTALLKKIGR